MNVAIRRRLPVLPSFRRVAISLAIGAFAVALAILTGRSEFVRRVEHTSYDRRVERTAPPLSPSTPIVIVDIDETSVRALEPMIGRWPWPRAVHAAAIDYMSRAGAKVIAVDILFGEREGRSQTVINGQTVSGDESDRALAAAVKSAGNVVLLGEGVFEGSSGAAAGAESAPPLELPGRTYAPGRGFEARPTFQLPFDDLRLSARGVGHNVVKRDPGGDFVRRMLPFIDVGGVAVPSLGMAAALAYLDAPVEAVTLDGQALRVGETVMPLLDEPTTLKVPSRQALLRFAQPVPGADGVTSVFASYSFFDVLLSSDQLAAGKTPAVPPSAFAGKLVFVGTSAAGTFDRVPDPIQRRRGRCRAARHAGAERVGGAIHETRVGGQRRDGDGACRPCVSLARGAVARARGHRGCARVARGSLVVAATGGGRWRMDGSRDAGDRRRDGAL